MLGHAIRRQVIAGILAQRVVRAGMDAGRTRAAEGNGRRLIFRTRNRTDPISGFAKNGDALEKNHKRYQPRKPLKISQKHRDKHYQNPQNSIGGKF